MSPKKRQMILKYLHPMERQRILFEEAYKKHAQRMSDVLKHNESLKGLNTMIELISTFIQETSTVDTGGGIVCDLLKLDDGTLLIVTEESIALYESEEDFSDGKHIGGTQDDPLRGVIFRHLRDN